MEFSLRPLAQQEKFQKDISKLGLKNLLMTKIYYVRKDIT